VHFIQGMSLDILTLVAAAVVLVAVLGLLQLWLWHRDRTLTALAIWGAGHLLAAAGLLLLSGRAILPTWISIDIANALVIGCYSLIWAGARRFVHRPISIAVIVAGPAVWLALCQVPFIYDSVTYRVAVISVTIAVIDLLTVRVFMRAPADPADPMRRFLGIIFLLHAGLQFGRALAALTIGFDEDGFDLPNASWFALPALGGLVVGMVTSILLIAAAKDAAQRQALETLAEARDTAERANLAKSRFLARMSHELRTPLNGMLGMAQALTRDPQLLDEQRQWAVLLEQSGQHLLAIVNDILDLARAETGKFELTPKPMLVRGLAESSRDLLRETATQKDVSLHLTIAEDTPLAVTADAVRVRQIILNLLGNAIKFTPAGGQVTLAVSGRAGGAGLRLAVRDTGPGVPATVVPYLFQDLMLCPMANTSPDGTGMGLSICAALAQAMGGTISYQPAPDGGSVFTVDLPLPAAEPPDAPAAAPAQAVRVGPLVKVTTTVAKPEGSPEKSLGHPFGQPPGQPLGQSAGESLGPPVGRQTGSSDVIGYSTTQTRAGPDPATIRVLVVDDVAANRRLAEVLLRQAGFVVDLAADGAATLAALARVPLPDVILMDVYMPGIDGPTVTRRVRALAGPIAQVPIIAVTADISPEQVRACEASGMNGYIAKPFNVPDLVASILDLVSRRRMPDPATDDGSRSGNGLEPGINPGPGDGPGLATTPGLGINPGPGDGPRPSDARAPDPATLGRG
jgi:signal transduction histidine kinase/CheY-like chemotaxis protein